MEDQKKEKMWLSPEATFLILVMCAAILLITAVPGKPKLRSKITSPIKKTPVTSVNLQIPNR